MNQSLIGTAVGNYRIVDVLGEGGMGTVYRAHHPELDRTVAIKVLALGLAHSADVVGRFRVEARAVNRIRHPNVVDIQDFGTLPDGRPYYVMEFFAGESLGHYLKRVVRLSARDAIVLMLPVTEALDAAHTAGVVHRDLKPDNIFLLAREGGPPIPKLLDFGIAKVLSSTISAGTARTQSGAVMGTPLYMSPEQASGRVEELGTPSDVYSLGVILFELLAGAPPFNSTGMGELLVMHMQQPPPRLSSRAPDVPPQLENLVMRMLEKSPSARPVNAGAVRDELRAIAASLSVDGNRPLERSPFAPTFDASNPAIGAPVHPAASSRPSAMVGEVARRSTLGSRKNGRWLALAGGTVALAGGAIAIVLARDDGDKPLAAKQEPPSPVETRATPVDAAPPVDAPAPIDAAPDAEEETELERRLRVANELFRSGKMSKRELDAAIQKIMSEHGYNPKK